MKQWCGAKFVPLQVSFWFVANPSLPQIQSLVIALPSSVEQTGVALHLCP
jgi:hypothetical protein